jgi:D-arabinose 1-dehydrogenase-like Zn-dependent alcohol dehydrogenase
VPAGLDPAGAAPLLCAGITTYSPLRQWGCKPGDRVGVVGLGGLGHMAVKLAASMGAEVTMFGTSASKEADARRLGAHAFALSTNEATFQKLAGQFDLRHRPGLAATLIAASMAARERSAPRELIHGVRVAMWFHYQAHGSSHALLRAVTRTYGRLLAARGL